MRGLNDTETFTLNDPQIDLQIFQNKRSKSIARTDLNNVMKTIS